MICGYKEIVDAINKTNSFSIGDLINSLLLMCSIITIVFLLIDKYSKGRPYLQVSIEMIRSSLACVVIKNVGEVSLSLKKITFDREFIEQLSEYAQKYFKDTKINNLLLHPGSKWVMCFGTSINDILKNYDKKAVLIKYEYTKLNRKKYIERNIWRILNRYHIFLFILVKLMNCLMKLKKVQMSYQKNLQKLRMKSLVLEI